MWLFYLHRVVVYGTISGLGQLCIMFSSHALTSHTIKLADLIPAFSKRFWRVGYLLEGVDLVTPEYRKMLWDPFRGDSQTFQGGCLVSPRLPGLKKAGTQDVQNMMAKSPWISLTFKSAGKAAEFIKFTCKIFYCIGTRFSGEVKKGPSRESSRAAAYPFQRKLQPLFSYDFKNFTTRTTTKVVSTPFHHMVINMFLEEITSKHEVSILQMQNRRHNKWITEQL